MLDFYTAATPNGHKIAIALEELALPYRLHILDLEMRQQKEEWYLRINPNGRIPAIIDNDGDEFPVFNPELSSSTLPRRRGLCCRRILGGARKYYNGSFFRWRAWGRIKSKRMPSCITFRKNLLPSFPAF
jgi:hypothetical protein